jgi:hypothetical protein
MQVPENSSPGQVLAPLWQVSPASAPAVNGTYYCIDSFLRAPLAFPDSY